MTHVRVTGKELKELHDKFGEIVRRVADGTIKFTPTKVALQRVLEGEFESAPPPVPSPEMRLCQDIAGHCSICHSYIDDGGTCQNMHQVGQSYPAPRF